MSDALGRALVDSLDLDALADALAPLLEARIGGRPQSDWLTTTEAAEHLRCPISRVHALSSAKEIPVHRDGSRLLFRRTELDRWVEAGGGRRP